MVHVEIDSEPIREIIKEVSEETISGTNLICMLMLALLWFAIFAGLIWYVLLPYLNKNKKALNKNLWTVLGDNLAILFGIAWWYGFTTYFIGTFVGDLVHGGIFAPFSVIPMAAIHATEMFAGVSDISAIHSDRHNSIWFMAMFDTSHLLAILVSSLFVFKHFGYYISSKYKIIKEKYKTTTYDNTYVFWGTSDATLYLAEDLIDKKKDELANSKIFFVKVPDEDNQGNHLMGFDRLFNYVSMRDKELDKISGIEGSIMFSSHHRISELEFDDKDEDDKYVFNRLRLKTLAKLLRRTTGRVNFFFLGENFDTNINAVINLMKDDLIIEKNVHIYCQTSQNAKTRWMQHYHLTHPDEKITIHVVDTAFLSIASLKRDPEKHPAQYVQFDNETCFPKSQFNSLVIGFGETGLEALKYLYEYSTFIKDDDGNRAFGMHTVIDETMNDFKGGFYAKAPALRYNNEINLQKCKINSDRYWELMNKLLPKLNYVIIAIGDDNTGINAAVEICKMARRCYDLENRHKLTVFVRSYEEDNFNRLQKVCDDINVSCKDLHISMELFGSVKQLFTYDMIVDDIIMYEAKLYNWSYQDFGKAYGQSMDVEKCWEDQVLPKKDDGGEKYNMSQLEEIDRLTTQNICNSLHRGTKICILQQSIYWDKIREWIIDYMKQSNDQKKLTREWLENKPYYNTIKLMAMLEHQRWVACSKLDGWVKMPLEDIRNFEDQKGIYRKKQQIDFRSKHHADICDWKEIRTWKNDDATKETQEYDFKVVYTSVLLDSFKKEDGKLDRDALMNFTENDY